MLVVPAAAVAVPAPALLVLLLPHRKNGNPPGQKYPSPQSRKSSELIFLSFFASLPLDLLFSDINLLYSYIYPIFSPICLLFALLISPSLFSSRLSNPLLSSIISIFPLATDPAEVLVLVLVQLVLLPIHYTNNHPVTQSINHPVKINHIKLKKTDVC